MQEGIDQGDGTGVATGGVVAKFDFLRFIYIYEYNTSARAL